LDKSPDKVQKLCDAAKNGDVNGVNQLLASGIDPDGLTRNGMTALMAAAGGGHLRVVEALLAGCADPNVGKGSETPLTIAFQKGNQDILKALFSASFNTLDTMVGSSSALGGLDSYQGRGPIESVPENADDQYRDITRKLAAVSKDKRESSPERTRYGNYADKMSDVKVTGEEESDLMRTDACRMTLRTLGKASKSGRGY